MIIESRFGAEGFRDLDRFIARARIEPVPVDAEHAHMAGRRSGTTANGTIEPLSTSLIALPMRR